MHAAFIYWHGGTRCTLNPLPLPKIYIKTHSALVVSQIEKKTSSDDQIREQGKRQWKEEELISERISDLKIAQSTRSGKKKSESQYHPTTNIWNNLDNLKMET